MDRGVPDSYMERHYAGRPMLKVEKGTFGPGGWNSAYGWNGAKSKAPTTSDQSSEPPKKKQRLSNDDKIAQQFDTSVLDGPRGRNRRSGRLGADQLI